MKALIYDIEIEKAILGRGEEPIEGVEYCKGWGDKEGMGVSVIGALEVHNNRPRVFCADNFDEFQALVEEMDLLVGFNSIPFDNAVLRANGIEVPDEKSYDLLRELWAAAGLGPVFNYRTHGGYSLDATCKANFGTRKTGNGAMAPALWQQGKVGTVIDYCLNDVRLTAQLFELARQGLDITSPKNGEPLTLRRP